MCPGDQILLVFGDNMMNRWSAGNQGTIRIISVSLKRKDHHQKRHIFLLMEEYFHIYLLELFLQMRSGLSSFVQSLDFAAPVGSMSFWQNLLISLVSWACYFNYHQQTSHSLANRLTWGQLLHWIWSQIWCSKQEKSSRKRSGIYLLLFVHQVFRPATNHKKPCHHGWHIPWCQCLAAIHLQTRKYYPSQKQICQNGTHSECSHFLPATNPFLSCKSTKSSPCNSDIWMKTTALQSPRLAGFQAANK